MLFLRPFVRLRSWRRLAVFVPILVAKETVGQLETASEGGSPTARYSRERGFGQRLRRGNLSVRMRLFLSGGAALAAAVARMDFRASPQRDADESKNVFFSNARHWADERIHRLWDSAAATRDLAVTAPHRSCCLQVVAAWCEASSVPSLVDIVTQRVLSALAPAGGYQSSWGTLLLVLGG
jgi:hypothetical protein